MFFSAEGAVIGLVVFKIYGPQQKIVLLIQKAGASFHRIMALIQSQRPNLVQKSRIIYDVGARFGLMNKIKALIICFHLYSF